MAGGGVQIAQAAVAVAALLALAFSVHVLYVQAPKVCARLSFAN
jgi:hypothetical protein